MIIFLLFYFPFYLGQTANCVCVLVEHFLAGSGAPKASYVTVSLVEAIMVHVQ